jgi:hypothetical protein
MAYDIEGERKKFLPQELVTRELNRISGQKKGFG